MLNKLKNKIKIFFSSKKRTAVFLFVLSVFILILVIYTQRNKEEVVLPVPTPTETFIPQSADSSTLPYTFNANESYYINQIVTNTKPVTGFSWSGNKLVYSTPTGIFKAGTNEVVVTAGIEKIIWGESFNALVKTNGFWSKLNTTNKSLDRVNLNLVSPKINVSGNKIIDFQKNIATVYDIDSGSDRSVTFGESVDNAFFIPLSQGSVVSTAFGTKTHVYKLTEAMEIETSVELNGKYHLASVSKDGKNFVLISDNNLYVADFSGITATSTFKKDSILSAFFTSNASVIVIEKYRDSIGRILDNIYLEMLDGSNFIVSDSKPMVGRINQGVPMATNTGGSVVAFAENDGKTWILALKPNLYPTYSESGELVFSTIKPESH